MTVIHAADLFCGAGGTSTGLALAAQELGFELKLTAVNHWDTAIETHAANHPWAEHHCCDLSGLKPGKVIKSGRLDLLVASPECTHHSRARGGRPICDQSRASAWHILYWCQELYVRNLLVENVPEFTTWGPVGVNGRPLKSKKGETFTAFVNALKSLGYRVDWRIINCADYGDATTRERFFLMGTRGRKKLAWPVQAFGKNHEVDMFGGRLRPWRVAREIIDWSDLGHSIFLDGAQASRLKIRRPLKANTLARIEEGVRKFCGVAAEPFIVVLRGTSKSSISRSVRSVDMPLPTVATSGGHIGLCSPFILNQHQGGKSRGVDECLPAVTCTGAHRLVTPFIVKYYGNGGPKSVKEPIGAVTTRDRFSLVSPMGGAGFGVDILMRMLKPKELAAAHSFPEGYRFFGGKKDVLKQIGNSVPVMTAKALCNELLAT